MAIDNNQFERLVNALERIASALERSDSKQSVSRSPSAMPRRYKGPDNTCPACSKSSSVRKDKSNDTYYCWAKIGGCGRKNMTAAEVSGGIKEIRDDPEDSSPEDDSEPDPVAEQFSGRKVENNRVHEEQQASRIARFGADAWLTSSDDLTEDDVRALRLIQEKNGWFPQHHPRMSRQQFSIKFIQEASEDSNGRVLSVQLRKSLVDFLWQRNNLESTILARYLLNCVPGGQTFAEGFNAACLVDLAANLSPEVCQKA